MRGADGSRRDTIPFRSEPARAHVPEDFLERSATINGEESGHVLEEEGDGAALAEDAEDVRPEPSIVIDSAPLAGDACPLAGETGNDEIHAAAIEPAVEGLEIVPYRSRIQGTLRHSSDEDARRVGLSFNKTHTLKTGQNHPGSEIETSVPGAE